MTLTAVREQVAAALEHTTVPDEFDATVTLYPSPAEAVESPALLLTWGPDATRELETFRQDRATLEVIAIAGRTDLDGAYPLLEALIDAACADLLAASIRHVRVTTFGPLDVGGVTYLTARIQLAQPIPIF